MEQLIQLGAPGPTADYPKFPVATAYDSIPKEVKSFTSLVQPKEEKNKITEITW